MDSWLQLISDWFVKLVKAIFGTIADVVGDAIVWCVEGVLSPIGDFIASISVPSFMTSSNILEPLNVLPGFALYVVSHINLVQAMGMISAAVVFRLARKAITLGQW